MIKFFRKIRQQLLTENKPDSSAGKFNKYLIYAIGEILLVVIGIMIALQINNWNETRISNNKAAYLLSSLKEDLQSDLEELKSNIQDAENLVTASIELNKIHQNPGYIPDNVQTYVSSIAGTVSFDLNDITYQEMLNSGTIELLSRDIRKAIAKHYWLIESYDGNRDNVLQLKHAVNQSLLRNGCVPNAINLQDLRKAMNDKRFLAEVKQWEHLGSNQIDVHKYFYQRTQELIEEIEGIK